MESATREIMPPTTTCANGHRLSLPIPCESAAGMSPTQATIPLIRIGRGRTITARRVASSMLAPSCRSLLAWRRKVTVR